MFGFLLSLAMLLYCPFVGKADEESHVLVSKKESHIWTPSIADFDHLLEVISVGFNRHPNMVGGHFPVDLLKTYQEAAEVLKHLNNHAGSLEVSAQTQIHSYRYSGQARKEDSDALNDLKTKIKSHYRKLAKLNFPTRFFVTDFAKIPENLRFSFFAVSPFLYDFNGKATNASIESSIDAATILDFEILYDDIFKYRFLKSLISHYPHDPSLENILNKFLKDFINREVRRALMSSDFRGVSIEEMPRIFSPFRAFGEDCSAICIPLYGFGKQSKTYLIRRNNRVTAPSSAYALVTFVSLKSKPDEKIPYILTINRNSKEMGLSVDDVRASVKLISSQLGFTKVIVPNFEKNKNLVNSIEATEGMTFSNSMDVQVDMPPDWKIIEKFTKENQPIHLVNYYASENVEEAKLVEFESKVEIKTHIFPSPYDPEKIFLEAKPKMEKSLFANRVLRQRVDVYKQKVLENLNLTEEEFKAGSGIAKLSDFRGLSLEEFKNANRFLGFKIEDLENFHPIARATTLGNLYFWKPSLSQEKTWRKLGRQTANYLKEQIENLPNDIENIEIYRRSLETSLLNLKDLAPEHVREINEDDIKNIFDFAKGGQIATLNKILELSPSSIFARDKDGKTIVHWAGGQGKTEVLKYLYTKNPTVLLSVDNILQTAAHWIASADQFEALAFLYEILPEIILHPDIYGQLPLHGTGWNGQLRNAIYLYEKAPQTLSLRDAHGKTPVYWAAFNGHINFVKYFVDKIPQEELLEIYSSSEIKNESIQQLLKQTIQDKTLSRCPETIF